MEAELAIHGSFSLKDRRRVVNSLKQRLRQRFNISVAEVGNLESRKTADLAVALVANDATFVHQALQQVVNYVHNDHDAALVDYDIEIL